MVNTKGSFFVGTDQPSPSINKNSTVMAKDLYTAKHPPPKVVAPALRHTLHAQGSNLQIKTAKNSTLSQISQKTKLNQSPYRMANL